MSEAAANPAGGRDAVRSPRLRGDLEVHSRTRFGRRHYWIMHPITGRVVRLLGRDFGILRGDAGHAGAHATLVSEAIAAGLVAGRAGTTADAARAPWWRNPLYVRLPGMPADQVARALASRSGWLFSRGAVILWCLVIAATAIGVAGESGRLAGSLDALATFQANHWGIVLATLALTKVVHELAHAAVCRRMGAAVREIGVLLLCGTPCLYCDVTDSWRVESRRRRAAIMLAGVYVELVIAALAAIVWMTSGTAWQRLMALNVMMVCGVSTVLFNLNPLMRYDGYFVLSDFLDVPNLRRRAAEAWRWGVMRPIAGEAYMASPIDASRGARSGLALYHAGSAIYRLSVFAALAGWGYVVISRSGLEPIGRALIGIAVLVLIAGMARRATAVVGGRGAWSLVPRLRRFTLASVGIAGVAGLLFIPVQRRIAAQGVVQLHDAVNVYVSRSGRVARVGFDYGSEVCCGDVLAQMDEPAVRIERVRLESRVAQLRIRQASLKRRALDDPELLEQLEGHVAALRATDDQLHSVDAMLDELTLLAPRDGTVLPVVQQDPPAEREGRRLSDSLGQTRDSGSIWCCIGDEAEKQVLLEVDASRRRLVEKGSRVQVQIDQSPGAVVSCEVDAVSAMQHDEQRSTGYEAADRFVIACRLPVDIARRTQIGATATGVIRGEPVCLWDWCLRRVQAAVSPR